MAFIFVARSGVLSELFSNRERHRVERSAASASWKDGVDLERYHGQEGQQDFLCCLAWMNHIQTRA